jgi:hypothetical protein
MKKLLYANGDSMLFGMECLEDGSKKEENKQLAFPKHISDALGCSEYINNSYNGASNDFIFKTTLADLELLESAGHDPKDVFVVIGVTSLHRSEIDGMGWFGAYHNIENTLKRMKETGFLGYPVEYEKHGIVFVQPGLEIDMQLGGQMYNMKNDIASFFTKYLWTETVQLESQEARMIALHEILKLKGYDHIFVNSVCPLERTKHIDVACKNFYKIDQRGQAFWEYAVTKYGDKERRRYNHFTPVAHESFGKELVDYIVTNII